MDGQDDRFSSAGGAQSAPSDGYGFFGGPPAAQGNQFGSAAPAATPSAGPVGQFGYPPPAAGTGTPAFGTPYAPPTAPTYSQTSSKGKRKGVAAAVIGLVVIGVAGYGWNNYQLHKPLNLPTTLGSLPTLQTPELATAMASSEQAWEQQNPGHHMKGSVYGSVATKEVVILVAARGRVMSIEKDFASGGASSLPQKIGKNSCASLPNGGTACERTSRYLTEAVVSISTTRTLQQTSALLDEAWSNA